MRLTSVVTLVLAVCAGLAAQPTATFSPPRAFRVELPDLPAPTIVGGGEVLIEATVDSSGALTRPLLLRSTPPYTSLVLNAVSRWTFRPARASNGRDPEVAVEAPILIAAIYRPPTLYDGPTPGEPPKDVGVASGEAAYPAALVGPVYPPQAVNPAVVMFEVLVDENGRISEALLMATDRGFESAARDALLQWTFRPALVRGRPAPSTAYVIFGFRSPVVSSVPRPPSPPR